jgi:DNA polymerase-3 subunit gamma/tau
MSDYQVIARKFRPQSFRDVIGQDAIVTTLKNAMKFNRLAQAYLFCGSRGTGKTTLARLLAKAINCQQLTSDYEPCNQCTSCREIAAGTSLDVLEIDGASHRGIEDIRQINETIGYAAASGHYKIYIIDEVHMLTKEAFNALLKTLEEPPPKVKFFFATTEPHKVLPTILSRCQRFNLNRISLPHIVVKLRRIAHQLGVEVEEDALRLLAQRAEGGLRDAESLFDQILAFEEGRITVASVTKILGLMPRDIYFEIDQAGEEGQFAKAFEIAHRVFTEGKDLTYFIEGLIDHLRQILLVKVAGSQSSFLTLTESEKEKYVQSAQLYSQEQCLDLIEYLLEAQNQLRVTAFGRVSLEAILLHVMRSHFRLSIDQLVRHLSELERMIGEQQDQTTPSPAPGNAKISAPLPAKPLQAAAPEAAKTISPAAVKPPAGNSNPSVENPPTHAVKAAMSPPPSPKPSSPAISPEIAKRASPTAGKPNLPPGNSKPSVENPTSMAKVPAATPTLFDTFVSEDPTPTPADLGKSVKAVKNEHPLPAPKPSPPSIPLASSSNSELTRPLHEYDTLMHFAAVELEGRLQKN